MLRLPLLLPHAPWGAVDQAESATSFVQATLTTNGGFEMVTKAYKGVPKPVHSRRTRIVPTYFTVFSLTRPPDSRQRTCLPRNQTVSI